MPPPPPPDGLAPAGLYVFDVEVIGIAPGYDEDTIRSRNLRFGEHEVILPVPSFESQPIYRAKTSYITTVLAQYILRGSGPASQVHIDVYDSIFQYLTSVDGSTHTISFAAEATIGDINKIIFSISMDELLDEFPYTFIFWAWDDFDYFYKNHKAKTTFTNDKEEGVPHAHFFAEGAGQWRNQLKEYLQGVWHWVRDRWGRLVQKLFPLASKYICYHGQGSLTAYEPFQDWEPDRILDAIQHVQILTLKAHGDFDKMGERFLWPFDVLTAKQIIDKFSGTWLWWDASQRRYYQRVGLSHLRVVLLLGCKTGGRHGQYTPGDPLPPIYEVPAEGSIAHAFWNLCARIVIHCTYKKAHDSALIDFIEQFYKYARNNPIVQAAEEARRMLFERVPNKGYYVLYNGTLANIKIAIKPGAENLYLAP